MQGLKQGGPERLAQEKVDERIQDRVQGGQEKRAFLQLKKEKLELTVKQESSGLAHGVGHSVKVKGHKAHKEHPQDKEHVGVHWSSGLLRPPDHGSVLGATAGPCADVGLSSGIRPVQLFGDEGVADNHCHQVAPKDYLTYVIDRLMPAKPGIRLQVAAFEIQGGWVFAGEDHIGQAQAQQEDPDGCRQELMPSQLS